ncbi:MAG: hypothetical protein ACSLE9_21085 [Burkholderiaceae bacterium]
MPALNWSQVQDRPTERLEFGANHVLLAWRRHKTAQSKFLGLESAFKTSSHRLPRLLQAVDSNYNARNHPERGQAVFAAVWFRDSPWAILCSATHATLVSREVLEAIGEQKNRNDDTTSQLRAVFDASPPELRKQLDDMFYDRILRRE